MKKWTFVALLLVGAIILGATVLREPIANAAQIVNANITSPLDANGNVAVHEQGTAKVNVTNTTVPVAVRGTAATRSANDEVSTTQGFGGPVVCHGDMYTVPADKQLVIEYISSVSESTNGSPVQSQASIFVPAPNGGVPLVELPFVFQPQDDGDATASEAVHYVVGPGTVLEFLGFSSAASGNCQMTASLGGYLQ